MIPFALLYLIALIIFIRFYYKKYKLTEEKAQLAKEISEKEILTKLAKKQRKIFIAILLYFIITPLVVLVVFNVE